MTDIRVEEEAVEAVKWFIGTRGLLLRWWKPSDGSSWSVQGSERGIALVDGFLAGWRTARNPATLPESLHEHITAWLKVNKKQPDQVRHGLFPLGMVQRWIERAEAAESAQKAADTAKVVAGEVMDDLCHLSDLLADSMELRVEETPAISRLDEAIRALDTIVRKPGEPVDASREVGQRTPLQWDDASADPWATKPRE